MMPSVSLELNKSPTIEERSPPMKINFTPETYQALIARANREDKAAAALVNELITAVLNKEEKNDKTETSGSLR